MGEIIGELVPIAFFATVVAIVWIVFHGRKRDRNISLTTQGEQETMERMIGLLEKMEGRIATLERILDAEDPRWREKVPPSEHL